MEDFQVRGEPYRRMFGIGGTAGDAQDVPHSFVPDSPDSPGGPCVACGMGGGYQKHTEDWAGQDR